MNFQMAKLGKHQIVESSSLDFHYYPIGVLFRMPVESRPVPSRETENASRWLKPPNGLSVASSPQYLPNF